MAAPSNNVKVTGLVELVAALKGTAFKDVNRALRPMARGIADELRPHVELMVRLNGAHQAQAMSKTVRTKPDRVPTIIVGKVNPKFEHEKRFTRKNSDSTKRRGSLAHGVIYGPKGGKRSTSASENYYGIARDDNGGRFGHSVKNGTVFEMATREYLAAFMDILTHYGFASDGGHNVHWKG